MNVNDITSAASRMHGFADLVGPLMGGTKAMREAGEAMMPRFPAEETGDHSTRISLATLFPAYEHTVVTLTGKPFSKPLTINDDVPPTVSELLDDIDRQGQNLHNFAAAVTQDALAYGFAGILVEYPVKPAEVTTRAEEKAAGLRPYWVHIRSTDVLGWIAERSGGDWVLRQLRIMECAQEPDGEFGVTEVKQIRVIEQKRWRTFRESKEQSADGRRVWAMHEEGPNAIGRVPFVPVYGQRCGFMQGRPPLLELAYLNIKHWQSQSDQDTILHVARVPILFGKAFGDQVITIGSKIAVTSDSPEADLKFVEHSGSAIGAGKIALDDLKEEMRQSGAELLVIQPGDVTATQVATENAVGMCALQRIALGVEDSINTALQLTADWIKAGKGGTVKLFSDFGAATLAEASSDLLLRATQTSRLSKRTWFNEMKRRGILSAELDFDEEQERIDEEGPPMPPAPPLPGGATPPGQAGQPGDVDGNDNPDEGAGGAPGGTGPAPDTGAMV